MGVKLPDFIMDTDMYCSFRGYLPTPSIARRSLKRSTVTAGSRPATASPYHAIHYSVT